MVGYEDAGVLGVGAEYTAPGKHHVTTDDDQARRLHGNIASPKVFIGMGYGRTHLSHVWDYSGLRRLREKHFPLFGGRNSSGREFVRIC